MGRRLGAAATGCLLAVLAACGESVAPGADGRVEANPRALAAVVVDHVGREPRRTTGSWSDANDPLSLDAQVDYGVDPEGTEDGETHTVRVEVATAEAFSEEAGWLGCRAEELEEVPVRCSEEESTRGTLVFRWDPGGEEDPAYYSWTLFGGPEVVIVAYDGSGTFAGDPRDLGLPVEAEQLRLAALDPAMSLRTTPEMHEAGQGLTYDGMEEAPPPLAVRPITPQELGASVEEYLEIEAETVGPSPLDDFGPDAVGARLTFAGTRRYDAFTLDILTTVGRVPQIDPLPCPVQDSGSAARSGCFAWEANTSATWTLAEGNRPGVLWIIGAQDDDKTNRVESVGVRIVSSGIDQPFFSFPGTAMRIPETLLALGPMTGDLRLGPEVQIPAE